MKKYLYAIFGLSFFSAIPAHAMCPVCTVAVGAGLGVSRWFGIDDTISGLWTGALLVSMSLWTLNYFAKKNIRYPFIRTSVFAFYFVLTIVPLFFTGILGHPFNTLLGIDKFVFGAIFGTISFFTTGMIYSSLKAKNGGKPHFPYEKVALSLVPLMLLSVVFYFITK